MSKQNLPTDQQLLNNLGFKAFNDIQNQLIDVLKENQNAKLIAPTGSGKTVAFVRSVLPYIDNSKGIQVLILAPTRELVLQIEQVIKSMKLGVKSNAFYGGHSFKSESQSLIDPPVILVGTPGRIEDHFNRRTIDPNTITTVIFDEFDKSLEYGFSSQMEHIMDRSPNISRRILVSATSSIKVPDYVNFFEGETVKDNSKHTPQITIKQLIVPNEEKFEGLLEILSVLKQDQNAIVFVNHQEVCERIAGYFNHLDISYSIFHGGLKQEKRELELVKFRNGSSQILIATDIAARGIDILDLDLVVHYQLPQNEAGFIHRNGRTARMKKEGECVLLRTIADGLPDYINSEPDTLKRIDAKELPRPSWVTLYIGKGKKDKINKIDLVGFFLQFDFMDKSDLGFIEMKDYTAYVAVKRSKVEKILSIATTKKIKNKKVKIEMAR